MVAVSQHDDVASPCITSNHDEDLAYAKMLQEQDYAWYLMTGVDDDFGVDDEWEDETALNESAHVERRCGPISFKL